MTISARLSDDELRDLKALIPPRWRYVTHYVYRLGMVDGRQELRIMLYSAPGHTVRALALRCERVRMRRVNDLTCRK